MDIWLFAPVKAESKMEFKQQILVDYLGPLHLSYTLALNFQNFRIQKFVFVFLLWKRGRSSESSNRLNGTVRKLHCQVAVSVRPGHEAWQLKPSHKDCSINKSAVC